MRRVPDRTGETWEELPRPEHKWAPGYETGLERFIVYDEPSSWYHPVCWIDEIQCLASDDPSENDGVNEAIFMSENYTRLG